MDSFIALIFRILIVLIILLVLNRVMFAQDLPAEYYDEPQPMDVFKGPGVGNFDQLCGGLALDRDRSCTTREFLERKQYESPEPVYVHPSITPRKPKCEKSRDILTLLGFIRQECK